MKGVPGTLQEGGAGFAATHWSLVLLTAQSQSPEAAQAAMASFCQTYWPPLYTFLRRQGRAPSDAQDLTQAFFAHLLEQKTLARACREKGRLRTFLLGSLRHFLANEHAYQQAFKRGGGKQIGVGLLAGPCGRCEECRRGDFVNCRNQKLTGVHHDGGYAESMIADENGLVAVPEELDLAEAAPLLCAGVTTFKALKNSPARPGDLVAILGVGGLGHLAVQFARKMGFRVAAIARGADKEGLVKKLGAHVYIDSQAQDAAAALQALGGASVIVATVSDPAAMSPLVGGLRARGRLIVVGAGKEPLAVPTAPLLFGERSLAGTLTGSTIETEDTLHFCALQDVHTQVETVPLAQAPQAYARMMRGEARFRMVLLMTA